MLAGALVAVAGGDRADTPFEVGTTCSGIVPALAAVK